MSRMTLLTLLMTAVQLASICRADVPSEAAPTDLSQLKVGLHCQIRTVEQVTWNQRSSTTYIATVKEINDAGVTLVDVLAEGRQENTTPVLGTLPYIKRFFKNVGIGRSHLGDKEVKLPAKRIAKIEVVSNEKFAELNADSKSKSFRRKGLGVPHP